MRKFSKNAIIIVGNGFDLAHGMPTSYNDFAKHYLETIISQFITFFDRDNTVIGKVLWKDNSVFNAATNNFLKIKISEFDKNESKQIESSNNNYGKFKNNLLELLLNDPNQIDLDKSIRSFLSENINFVGKMLSNTFLGKLFANEYDNWFDIERAYFEELKTFSDVKSVAGVKQLNGYFNEIKNKLKIYLNQIDIKFNGEVASFIKNSFTNKNNIQIVDFNYTYTIDRYINRFNRVNNISINQIHGDLNSEIIFGYGDDTSVEYQNIKNLDNDEYLENFKTYAYLMNREYTDLLNIIEDYNDYEVYVFRHSLGRTDKTLLKEIFDNKKCLNIHFFKRSDLDEKQKKTAFSALTKNLSRILDDESSLRKKTLSYPESLSFPKNEIEDMKKYNIELYGENFGIKTSQIN